MSDLEKPDYFEKPETHIDKQKIMNELKQKIADEKTNDELREEIQRLRDALMQAHDYLNCGLTAPKYLLKEWKELSHYKSLVDAQTPQEQSDDY